MLLQEIVAVSDAVAETRSRSRKVELLARTLRRFDPEELSIGVSFLSGRPLQDRLGIGWATVHGVECRPADRPELEIVEVDRALAVIAGVSGPGSKQRRETALAGLLGRATASEQVYLRNLILRNLRQGALEGIMADAVASAVGVPGAVVRRAAMVEGDLVSVAARSLSEGASGLGGSAVVPLTPVQPMLAKTATSAGEAVASIGTSLVERKLDGARIQVHRSGGRIAVYTRNLREVGADLPEVVASVASFPASSFILDGEALLLGAGGAPLEFQESMARFGADGSKAAGPPLTAYYFDCLFLEGVDLVDHPLEQRRIALQRVAPVDSLVASITTADPGEADRFFAEAVAAGFEGVMVKDPGQPYQSGRRGAAWLKVKPAHTLDLVVLAAEWGSGRRQGWLSNLHLGARDEHGGFVMLGKTFKGLTDEMLRWQTDRFLDVEDHRDGHVVYLRPAIVYEVAFDGVQRSSRYPGGVTLRFARVRGYRGDKAPAEADTIGTVRSLLRNSG